jgi:hypothetical protein
MAIEEISDHPDDEQFRAALAKRQRPDCGGSGFDMGPCGELQSVFCTACGHGFVAPVGPKIFFIQHLHKRL